jgi:sugar-specific transcriptional regulator TrmB
MDSNGGFKISVNRNTVTALKNLGLSDYEVKAYVANISLISATASEISLASNVPRSKIYEILKSLAKKDFVEIERGKPLKFNAIPPHEIIGKSRKQFNEKLNEAEDELNQIYEKQIPNVPAPLWLIHGPEKILKKEVEIISRAKKSVYIMAGLLFKDEIPDLKDSLDKAIKRGVHVKIILSPFYNDDEQVDLEGIRRLECEIKTLNVPLVKVLVRDDKEMLMGVAKIEDKKIMSRSAIGIWNQYTELVETIEGLYNFIWTTELFNKP